MVAPQVRNERTQDKKGRRRRKKRRTEDFSDTSSSLSDEASSHETTEQEIPRDHKGPAITTETIEAPTDTKKNAIPEPLTIEQQKQLQNIKLTATSATEGLSGRNMDMEADRATILADREQLEGEYLKFMASSFSEDLDELRKKPDFTDKSLVMLAKTLQSGGSLFDENELRALLHRS